MKIKKIPEDKIDMKAFIMEFKDRLDENEENIIENAYDHGYKDGYHDALVEVFNFLKIEHDENYYN